MSLSGLPVRRGNRRTEDSRAFGPKRETISALLGRRSELPNGAQFIEPNHDLGTGRSRQLSTARRVGWVVFGIQFAGFVIWTTVVWQRFALTYDFWLVSQASYQINHTGVAGGWQVINQHFGAVILWVFALLMRLPTHGLTLLWVQDLAVVGVGLVAFLWVCEMLERRPLRTGISSHWLALLALVFLVGNPWVFKTVAFDFHLEVFGTLFILLAARDLQQGRLRRSLVWIAATLSCGFVAATYVAGLAISALIAGRGRQRLVGAGLLVAGLGGAIVLTAAGGAGSVISWYAYLVGPHAGTHLTLGRLVLDVMGHPGTAVNTLWANRLDLIANLAPVGIVGIAWGWGFGVPIVVLLANALQYNVGLRFPSFQSLPVFAFVAVGSVVVLARMSEAKLELPGGRVRFYERGNPAIWAMSGVLALLTLGWAVTYTPQVSSVYLDVSSGAATVLTGVEAKIPQDADVIISQGVVGRFSYRAHVEPILYGGQSIPIETRSVWFIITPRQGIETVGSNLEFAMIRQVESSGAKVVVSDRGVWTFQWSPPSSVHSLRVPLRAHTVTDPKTD